MKTKTALLIAAAGLFALAGNAIAQTSAGPGPGAGTGPGPGDMVVPPPPLPEEIQALIQQFREQRHVLLEARAALVERLRQCTTDEQRRALIAEFRAQYVDQLREQAQLRKQIRQELMTLRRERRRAAQGGG